MDMNSRDNQVHVGVTNICPNKNPETIINSSDTRTIPVNSVTDK